jgi:chorismate synthase
MRYTTAGESHGRAVLAVVEGVPAGLVLTQDALDADLARRQKGYGRGGRMAIETDTALVVSGIRDGRTIGSPVALMIENRDWANWSEQMAAFDATGIEPVTAPRPGHADLAGVQKTGASDVRDVLERASARETAGRVAAGAVARAFLRGLGVEVRSVVLAIGEAVVETEFDFGSIDYAEVEASDVRCPDKMAATRMRAAIDVARQDGESLGGAFVVWADGLAPGVGGYATAAERLDGRLAGAVVSIPAIKAVGIGDGERLGRIPGSQAHDEIAPGPSGPTRVTNHAGGLEGGMTNGMPLVVRATMKPIPTLMRPLMTVDLTTGASVDAAKERSDVCAVPAAAVVAEAEVALVLADAYTAKFGGDCMEDTKAALAAYRERIGA